MPFTPADPWEDRPAELDPRPGESLWAWYRRVAAYEAANPGALTPLQASRLNDAFEELGDYVDASVASVESLVVDITRPPYSADKTGVADSLAAINTAIADIVAAGGGIVFFPTGTYKCTAALNTPANTAPVLLVGEGPTASRLRFPTDPTGSPTVLVAVSFAQAPPYGTGIRDLWIDGPAAASGVDSYPATKLDGLRLGGAGLAENVRVSGFRSGLQIKYDHEKAVRCRFQGNRYGVLFANDVVTTGDQIFDMCELDGNSYAAVAVEGTGALGAGNENIMAGTVFRKCHGGTCPYVFAKLAPVGRNMAQTLSLDEFAAEAYGNAIFYSPTATDIRGISVRGFTESGGFDASYDIAANPKTAPHQNVSFWDAAVAGTGFFERRGTLAVIEHPGTGVVRGDLGEINLANDGGLIFACAVASYPRFTCAGRRCIAVTVSSDGTGVAAGELLQYSAGNYESVERTQRDGATLRYPAGLALGAVNNNYSAVVVIDGPVQFTIETDVVVGTGNRVKPATTVGAKGRVTLAADNSDGPACGYVIAGGTGPALVSGYIRI